MAKVALLAILRQYFYANKSTLLAHPMTSLCYLYMIGIAAKSYTFHSPKCNSQGNGEPDLREKIITPGLIDGVSYDCGEKRLKTENRRAEKSPKCV
jgi:hypothetical protein